MKKAILSLFLAIYLTGMAFAYEQNITTGYGSYGSQISVSSLRYEPYPVEPGELFKIYLVVKNIGVEYTQNAACKIVNKFPFSVYSISEKNIGMLAPGREFLIDFDIKVEGNAIERSEELEVACSSNSLLDSWNIQKIPIKVQYRYSILNIADVKTIPEILPIGKQGKVMFRLVNNAENVINDVLVELDFVNSKLAPAQGITQKKIRNLNRNEGIDVVFDVYTLPTAEAGMYLVPLKINYTSSQGESKSFSTFITVKISDKPSYYISVESMEKMAGGSTITLKFVNNGQSDLQFFNVKVLESRYLSLKSNSQIYIGDLDSDDYLTESFVADISRSRTIIPLEITYKDPVGNDYKDYVNVSWDKSKIENLSEGSVFPKLIFMIIIAAAGYYFYRKRKNRAR